jgi:polyisoprenoid-binding protein YceI
MAHPKTCGVTGGAAAFRIGLAAVLSALLAACVPPPPSPPAAAIPPTPAEFPEAHYRQAEAAGRQILHIDPARSLVVIEVRRAGVLAGLGHDHVVASHDARGFVDARDGRADLYVPLQRLSVDEPGLRAEAKFDTQPSQDAIEGTRRNMLEKVLDAERFPFVLIHAARAGADPARLIVAITLHGTTRRFDIPLQTETLPDGLAVSGRLTFHQTDFGLTPYSVLGGALQVQDRLELRFRIVAAGG